MRTEKTWTGSAFLFLCIFYSSCLRDALACMDGPGNCLFEQSYNTAVGYHESWCSWTPYNWTMRTSNDDRGKVQTFAGLESSKVWGRLISRLTCSTEGEEHCLTFRYRFDTAGVIDLNIYTMNIHEGKTQRNKLWSLQLGNKWNTAYLPISTDVNFAVEFEAVRHADVDRSVYIDEIIYHNRTCREAYAVPTTTTTMSNNHVCADGPEDCDFSGSNLCSWTNHSGWSWNTDGDQNTFIGLGIANRGMLASRLACSTGGRQHCLFFRYKFSSDILVTLDVYIKNVGRNDRKRKSVAFSQSSNTWLNAYVPVKTNYDFRVDIEAVRRSGDEDSQVYIDDIKYMLDTPCEPPPVTGKGRPTTTVSTTTTTITPTSKTIKTKPSSTTTLATTTVKRTHPSSSPARTSITHRPVATNAPTSDSTTLTKPKTTTSQPRDTRFSTNIVVIVTAAIAVIILIVILLLLVILHRRNKLHCCRKQEKENFQVRAYHNAPNSSDNTDTEEVVIDENRDTNVVSSTGKPSQPSGMDNYSSVNTHYEDASLLTQGASVSVSGVSKVHEEESLQAQSAAVSDEYAVVNKAQKGKSQAQGASDEYAVVNKAQKENSGQDSSVQDEYAVVNKSQKRKAPPQKEPVSDEYAVVNKPRKETSKKQQSQAANTCQIPPGKRNTSQDPEQQTSDEYNVLHFDKSRKGVQEPTDGEGSAVYSHLREGDEDTYNEVDRERRTDVIDDEYSRVQDI